MNNLQDKDNLAPDYRFILDNLNFLTTECDWTNIKSKFTERKDFGIKDNQRVINLKRQIILDVLEGKPNEFIYFTAQQWETIVKTVKDKEMQSAL